MPGPAEREILQHTEVHGHDCRRPDRVPAERERPRRKRKGMVTTRINAHQRIGGTTALSRENGRDFDVTECSSKPAGGRRRFLSLVFLVLSDGQIPKRVKDKAPGLVLERQGVFRGEAIRILRLLVVIGGVVVSPRKRVTRRKFQLFVHLAAQSKRNAIVG